ncbi:MAG: hypothetical protein NW220_09920 [Leptolyngbyaceae cyanobacterium bins.349]|nr:hypothetical protein [Leptolyngbyaceae cyanobacterium bins.349]
MTLTHASSLSITEAPTLLLDPDPIVSEADAPTLLLGPDPMPTEAEPIPATATDEVDLSACLTSKIKPARKQIAPNRRV